MQQRLRQRIPSKPIRDGIKVFAVCCPLSGYCYFFLPQQWTARDKLHASWATVRPNWASIPALVLFAMSQAVRFFADQPAGADRRYCVFMDRYFTTYASCRKLLDNGFDCVGTLNTLYGGVDSHVLWPKKKARTHGAMRFARSADKRVGVQLWQDRSTMHVLTTMHTLLRGGPEKTRAHTACSVVKRRVKTSDGQGWNVVDVPCPPAIRSYQEFMGGVDKADQIRGYCIWCQCEPEGLCRLIVLAFAAPRVLQCPAEIKEVVHLPLLLHCGCISRERLCDQTTHEQISCPLCAERLPPGTDKGAL